MLGEAMARVLTLVLKILTRQPVYRPPQSFGFDAALRTRSGFSGHPLLKQHTAFRIAMLHMVALCLSTPQNARALAGTLRE